MGTERFRGIPRGTKRYRVVQGDRDGDQGDTEEYNKIQKVQGDTEGYNYRGVQVDTISWKWFFKT